MSVQPTSQSRGLVSEHGLAKSVGAVVPVGYMPGEHRNDALLLWIPHAAQWA